MVTADDIESWIKAGLPESKVVVVKGDGRHFTVVVFCSAFKGKNRITRHRLVYDTLGSRMKSDIHALSLKTYTPDEYSNQNK